MTRDQVTAAASDTLDRVPEAVLKALSCVMVVVEKSPLDEDFVECSSRIVMDEFGVTLPAFETPRDARGLYVGSQPEEPEDDEDETTAIEQPVGVVFLFADNLADEDDVTTVLCHELGHALGMSEDEVEALGLV